MRALGRALVVVPWVILGLCPAIKAFISTKAPNVAQWAVIGSLGVFFLVLLLRLAIAAARQPARRNALILMLVAVLLWAAGSALQNDTGKAVLTNFTGPAELLFLVAYVGIAAHLVLDAGKRGETAVETWLETAVICGGSACLAAGALAIPAAGTLGRDGLPLFLAVLYPLIDVVLFLLVIAQIALRIRASARQSAGLLIGFALLAIADGGFLTHLAGGTYHYGVVSVVIWGAAFALVVGSVCKAPEVPSPTVARRVPTLLVVSASMAASFVLAFEPHGTIRNYLVVPALATLAAAAARLTLAVRAANRAAEAIALSRSDDLTILPNRRAALGLLDDSLLAEEPLGLMILDLDGFKDVNDTLGHVAGDTVLRDIAVRMRSALDPAIMIARLGGDEFAVVATSEDETHLMSVAQLVLAAVREPMVIDGITLSMDASIGITARHATDVLSSELLRRADVAMYDAKRKRAGVLVYDAESDEFSRDRLRLGDEVRRGILDHQFALWYQPQFSAVTRQVCGLEALVRWNHPVHGLMSPGSFLPVARRAGLMQSLSEEIGRIAVADLAAWQSRNVTPQLAINCAPPELMAGIFLPGLYEMLVEADIAIDRIVIEVTEESFLADPERARALLLQVRQFGFQISLDDYGTGFSSLSYLRDLPIQELKLDRSFVAAMGSDARNRLIVASTFQLAAALGLRTVAEGVEDAATSADLIAMGVDVLQGYHLARPLPPTRIETWLRQSCVASSSL